VGVGAKDAFGTTTNGAVIWNIDCPVLSPRELVEYCALAVLQGALVALPRPAGSVVWSRLRSPTWALVLPGALIVGTFGVLAVPGTATGLALLAAVATPVLIGIAVMAVLRGPRAAWLAAIALLTAAALALHSWPAALAASALTAIGCLTLGAALVRLTPLPWLAAGIAVMCLVDVSLLGSGFGQPAAVQLHSALSDSGMPAFHQAQLGTVSKDYPDLVLAGVLGSALAGNARQLTAAVLVAVLVSANGVFFLVANTLPDTVPLAVAAGLVAVFERRDRAPRRATPKTWRPPAGAPRAQPSPSVL
jgi:hypothetical protein